MPTYVGKVQINSSGELMPIGSTLYGECENAADASLKVVALNNFNNYIHGITVHVKFINGNTATNNVQLKVGSTLAANVNNTFICNAGDVVSFTLEQHVSEQSGDTITTWQANTTRAHITSSNNIITTIDGQQINAATQAYVDNKTASIDGITGPMHFKGIVQELPQDNAGYTGGDVVVLGQQEYVYDGTSWRLLGDEGSYVLKTSQATDTAVGSFNFSANTLPTLETEEIDASVVTVGESQAAAVLQYGDPVEVINVSSVGSMTTAEVNGGLLTITLGTEPQLASAKTINNITGITAQQVSSVTSTPIKIKAVKTFNGGSQATLTPNNITVVTPAQQTP